MQYRRARTSGGTYFFTVMTHRRRRFLCEPENVALLKSVFQSVMTAHPFLVDAMVVLPDRIHCLWTLPADDRDFSTRWRFLKTIFTRQCGARHQSLPSAARLAKKEQAVWLRRFWEHKIRDEDDFRRHVDIHYNPVKHGLVAAPRDWTGRTHSSFDRYMGKGLHDAHWGASEPMHFADTVGNEWWAGEGRMSGFVPQPGGDNPRWRVTRSMLKQIVFFKSGNLSYNMRKPALKVSTCMNRSINTLVQA